jgi:hypothetical protein
MSQVHKETLSAVDNALPNRAGLDIEIFGMEGIPEDIIQQHNQRVLTQYHQAEAERRVASGSAGAAGTGAAGTQPKKPKFESPSDLKRRLAEHKAKLAAEPQNGGSSGGGTPLGANLNAAAVSRAQQISHHLYSFEQQVASPQYSQQQHFNGGPGNPPFNFPGGFGQPLQQTTPFQPPNAAFPQQSSFSPPFQNQPSYPTPQFPPPIMQSGAPQFPGPPIGGPLVGHPRPFGVGSPVQQFGFSQQQPPRIHTPPQSGPPPQRSLSGSLTPAPGLPQRPAFGAPHVNHFQMQQMHQGQVPGLPNQPINQPINQPAPGLASQQNNLLLQPNVPPPSKETSLDDLILGASKQAEEVALARAATETPKAVEDSPDKPLEKPTNEPIDEKKDKKEKSKASHLVYSDHESSPEEKMARMPRYAFTPEKAR